jgi:hypothetical protein
LVLKPVDQRSSMVQEQGIWVHLGKITARLRLAHPRRRQSRCADKRRLRNMKACLDTAVRVSASVADHPHHVQSRATLN